MNAPILRGLVDYVGIDNDPESRLELRLEDGGFAELLLEELGSEESTLQQPGPVEFPKPFVRALGLLLQGVASNPEQLQERSSTLLLRLLEYVAQSTTEVERDLLVDSCLAICTDREKKGFPPGMRLSCLRLLLDLEVRLPTDDLEEIFLHCGLQAAPLVVEGLARASTLKLLAWLSRKLPDAAIERATLSVLPLLFQAMSGPDFSLLARTLLQQSSSEGAIEVDNFLVDIGVAPALVSGTFEVATSEGLEAGRNVALRLIELTTTVLDCRDAPAHSIVQARDAIESLDTFLHSERISGNILAVRRPLMEFLALLLGASQRRELADVSWRLASKWFPSDALFRAKDHFIHISGEVVIQCIATKIRIDGGASDLREFSRPSTPPIEDHREIAENAASHLCASSFDQLSLTVLRAENVAMPKEVEDWVTALGLTEIDLARDPYRE